jgi:DNA-binding response OmpR family regulator
MGKKILIAENDPDILHILDILLKEAGYHVQLLPEGSSIVESQVDLPDLYVIDKDLPLIDGLAICKYLRIKTETRNIPIIMISAYHKLKQKAKDAGVNEFVEKPFDVHTFLRTIERCINGHNLRKSA